MKKFNILFLFTAFLFSACEQEEFTGTGLEALSDFDLTPISNEVELRSIYPDQTVSFNWLPAESGLESDVSYTWYAYEEDGSIDEPLLELPSNDNGLANQIVFTHHELDSILNSFGVEVGANKSLVWSVEATNGDITNSTSESLVRLKRFENEIAPFGLGSLADGFFVELDIDAPATEITVNWDSTFSGLGLSITYKWLAITPQGDFSDPLLSLNSNNNGESPSITFTHNEIDSIAASRGLSEGETLDLRWTVLAESEDISLMAESQKSISFQRFSNVDVKYLVGAATPGGWSWDNPTAVTEVEDGIYKATLVFNNETFRVFNTRDDWGSGNNFPYFEGEGFIIDDRFENAFDGDQNFRFIGTPGEYEFTIDYNAKLVYLDGRDAKFMVGAATPSGWNWDDPTVTMIQVKEGVWSVGLEFTNEAFRFFNTEGDWGSGTNYPFYSDDGYTIDANFENANDGDSNFRFVGSEGYYRIILDTVNKEILLNQ